MAYNAGPSQNLLNRRNMGMPNMGGPSGMSGMSGGSGPSMMNSGMRMNPQMPRPMNSPGLGNQLPGMMRPPSNISPADSLNPTQIPQHQLGPSPNFRFPSPMNQPPSMGQPPMPPMGLPPGGEFGMTSGPRIPTIPWTSSPNEGVPNGLGMVNSSPNEGILGGLNMINSSPNEGINPLNLWTSYNRMFGR